jgi:hypothetical protein
MRREILSPVAVIGIGLAGMSACSDGPEVPKEVLSAHTEVLEAYECDIDPANITITDLADESREAFGDEDKGLAFTSEDGITLDDDLSNKKMANYIIHESVHWCADLDTNKTYDSPVEIPGVGMLTSSAGFIPQLNGDTQTGATFVEEGVADWVAQHFDGYELHSEYASMAELTGKIAAIRGFDDETVMELHKEDNFLGFVALVKSKPIQEVTGEDIATVVNLYMNVNSANQTPTNEQLDEILNS